MNHHSYKSFCNNKEGISGHRLHSPSVHRNQLVFCCLATINHHQAITFNYAILNLVQMLTTLSKKVILLFSRERHGHTHASKCTRTHPHPHKHTRTHIDAHTHAHPQIEELKLNNRFLSKKIVRLQFEQKTFVRLKREKAEKVSNQFFFAFHFLSFLISLHSDFFSSS